MAFRIAVLCAAAAILCSGIRVIRPEIALSVAIAAGAAAVLLSFEELQEIVDFFKNAMRETDVRDAEAVTLIKAAGLSLAGDYAAQLCRDAGESSLAQRVEFAAKVSILALAFPIAGEAFKMLMELAG